MSKRRAASDRPGSSALRSAEASSRTRASSQRAAARASLHRRDDRLGRGPSPAAHAHDQVLGGFGGGGDHRLGAQHVGHGDGQPVGAAFVSADQADGPAAADIDDDHARIGRLVLQAGGHRPHDHARRRDVDQPWNRGKISRVRSAIRSNRATASRSVIAYAA